LPLLGKGETFVRKLKDENGNWIEGWDGLSGHINSYFCNLFNSKVEAPNDKVINKVKPCVSEAMNELLCAPYTREEVKKAMFNIGDLKAPAMMVYMLFSIKVLELTWGGAD
jgi:hypothetical protein